MRRALIAITAAVVVLAAATWWLVTSGALAESVRVRVVTDLARALGREVAVQRLSGDPFRGVVLEGVRIAAPAGPSPRTFFEAPRMTLRYNVRRLLDDLLHRRGIGAALTAVELARPFLVLARDAQGRWNYADLFAPRAGAVEAPAFTARVEVREGELVFSDALHKPGSPFAAHFERITGTVDFAAAPLVHFTLDAVNTDGRTPALLRVSGRSTLGEAMYDLDLSTRGASVDYWGPYLVRLSWLDWRGGTFDGTLHLLASRWGRREVLDYRGALVMRDASAFLLPQKMLFSDINGPLAVDNIGVSSDGLTMTVGGALGVERAGGSPVWVRGAITHLAGVHLDLAVRSPSLNLATLQRLFFPQARLALAGRAGGDVRIVGPADLPRLEGRIAQASGSINRQPFADFSGGFRYYGGLLIFDDVAASTGGGRLAGQLQLRVRDSRFFALADAQHVDARILPKIGIAIDPSLRGSATGFVAAAGAPGAIIAQGRVRLGRGSVLGVGFDALEALFGYDRGKVELDRLSVRGGRSTVHGFGEIGRTGDLALTLTATDVNLQTVAQRFGLQRWLAGTADVTGSVTGSMKSPVLSANVTGRAGRLGPFRFDDARGTITVTATGLATPGLVLRDGRGTYEAVGEVQWNAPARVDLAVFADGVPAQRLLDIAQVPLQLDGTVQSRVRLSGPLRNPQAAGSLTLRDGAVEGQRVDRVQADFRWTGSELVLDHASAAVNSSKVEARGTIGRSGRLAISFAATALTLRDIAPLQTDFLRVAGTADLSGTFSGTVASPTVNTTVASTSLVLNGQKFDLAQGSARYSRHRLTLAPLVLQQGSGIFQLGGQLVLRDDPTLDLRVSAQHGQLATLAGLAKVQAPFALGGIVDGEITVAGPLSNPRAVLDFRLSDGTVGDHPIREATIRAGLENHAVTLVTLRIAPGQGELVGAGRIDLRGVSEVEFSGRGVGLDILRPLFGIARPLGGTMDFTLQLSGRLSDPVVGLAGSVAEGSIGGTGFDRLVVQAFYRDGLLHIEQGLLQQGRHKARLEGTVPFTPARLRFDESRSMNLHLTLADSDLNLLGLLTDRVERAEGPLSGEVQLAGTVGKPKMEGSLVVSGGVVKLRGLEPPITAIRALLTFNEDEVRVGQFVGRAGAGTVTVSGTVGIRDFRLDALNLQLTADAARLVYVPILAGVVDGQLRIGGTAARPAIGGSLTLSQGDLFVAAPARPAGPTPEVSWDNPLLDMDLRAGDALWVNVGGLRLQVHGAVHTVGTWLRPRLTGEVTAGRGSFTAFNNTFTLTEGRAVFTEFRGTTPFVDARAEARIRGTKIFLTVQGTPDDLTLALSSDPVLPRDEIVALLARQAGLAQLLRGDLEGALRAELSNVLFGPFGRAVAQSLRLEEFTIEYDFERPLQLRIGKLLIRNLYITLTSVFANPPRHIWSLEYRLTPTTMLTFSVDNQRQFDFLYRITYRF